MRLERLRLHRGRCPRPATHSRAAAAVAASRLGLGWAGSGRDRLGQPALAHARRGARAGARHAATRVEAARAQPPGLRVRRSMRLRRPTWGCSASSAWPRASRRTTCPPTSSRRRPRWSTRSRVRHAARIVFEPSAHGGHLDAIPSPGPVVAAAGARNWSYVVESELLQVTLRGGQPALRGRRRRRRRSGAALPGRRADPARALSLSSASTWWARRWTRRTTCCVESLPEFGIRMRGTSRAAAAVPHRALPARAAAAARSPTARASRRSSRPR